MEQQIKQFETVSRKLSPVTLVIVTIIFTAAIAAGGTYWWADKKQIKLNDEVNSLRTELDQFRQIPINQSYELVEMKFKLAIRDLWGIRNVFRSPEDKNKFYFTYQDGSGDSIWVYDLANDKTYQKSGTINISEGNKLLLSQKLAQYKEFRGVGFLNNKFVFVETVSENSPGPCFSPWFYQNLEYIDLGISNPTRKPFVLPEDLNNIERQKVDECQRVLNSN